MNAGKRLTYFLGGLALAALQLLWHPLPAKSFPGNGGQAGQEGSAKAAGIAMLEVSGKVVETMNSGGYSYALIDHDGVKTWVALPKSSLAVGDEIACQPGMVMKNFRSTSLNRVFPQIVFSSWASITSSASNPLGEATNPPEESEPPKPKPPEDWNNF